MTYRAMRSAAVTTGRMTPESALLPYLLSIAKSVRQLVGIKLAECGVVAGQDQFLLCFADQTQRSVAEIAACLSVRASTISKMIDILESKGWVRRKSHEHDARKVLVLLTDAGCQVRDQVRGVWESLDAELSLKLADRPRSLQALREIDGTLNRRLRRLR